MALIWEKPDTVPYLFGCSTFNSCCNSKQKIYLHSPWIGASFHCAELSLKTFLPKKKINEKKNTKPKISKSF